MSLATRCPACGTVFRVVQDQLKVSEGWVRCGRCSEVFNAVDGLFDLETEVVATPAPHALDEAAANPDTAAEAPAPMAAADSVWPQPDVDDRDIDYAAAARPPPTHAAATVHASAGLAPPSRPAELDSAPPVEPGVPTQWLEGDESSALEGADAGDRAATPEFIRRADREARWRHPAMRTTLAVVALLLSISLATQLAWQFRDDLAVNWPPSRPWLALACEQFGCRIEAPRRIESLSVDASGLSRVANGALYQLSLVLHNRSAIEVRMPAIELALTDSRGRTTVRRVLYAGELGANAAALPPRAEMPLAATLDLGDRPVAGYTVELFYP